MSVRKVLENFLEHVKKLEAAEEEGGKGNFSREFQVNIYRCQNQLSDCLLLLHFAVLVI